MKALVLAAGLGTRIAGQTGGLPKPLIEIDGEPILHRTLRWLASHDIGDVWINLHHQADQIRQAVGDGGPSGTRVQYSFEPELRGTAGAVKNLQREWDDDFLVVCGDNLLGFDLGEMTADHKASGAIATLALFNWEKDPHSGIAGDRVLTDENGNIRGFIPGHEDPEARQAPWVAAGAYILTSEVCEFIPSGQVSDFGRNVFPGLLEKKKTLIGFPIQGYCLAVDTPEAMAQTQKLVDECDINLY